MPAAYRWCEGLGGGFISFDQHALMLFTSTFSVLRRLLPKHLFPSSTSCNCNCNCNCNMVPLTLPPVRRSSSNEYYRAYDNSDSETEAERTSNSPNPSPVLKPVSLGSQAMHKAGSIDTNDNDSTANIESKVSAICEPRHKLAWPITYCCHPVFGKFQVASMTLHSACSIRGSTTR
jgi:hypothetical protein